MIEAPSSFIGRLREEAVTWREAAVESLDDDVVDGPQQHLSPRARTCGARITTGPTTNFKHGHYWLT
ncbi:hypothetical protein EYF80_037302 [Liparis tanakae]|uniref:Uncharacterized protein n=1 Tax=Liparis tanakae TaxID=230148 RepID=A0A4Z2GH62_9TELE|nr:hypothetical protein EYF80_037302 [Liparis tanakae]